MKYYSIIHEFKLECFTIIEKKPIRFTKNNIMEKISLRIYQIDIIPHHELC